MGLHRSVREFLELVGDPDNSGLANEAEHAVYASMAESGDVFLRSPLPGALLEAYDVLEGIYASIKTGTATAATLLPQYTRFYSLLETKEPHEPIDTLIKVGKKVRLLERLGSCRLAGVEVVERCAARDYVLEFYRHLECALAPVDAASSEFKLVKRYVKNSSCCHRKRLQLLSVLRVDKSSLESRYSPFRRFDNRQVLWHGSRLENWTGILKKGLLVAPPGIQSNGCTFGKGLYFTDKVEKAHQYCASPLGMRSVLLLSEVALGSSVVMVNQDDGKRYVHQDAGGRHKSSQYHSCRGVGTCSPDARGNVVDADGAIWPVGAPVSDTSKSARHHTEFIIYNPTQTRMRYVVVLQRAR